MKVRLGFVTNSSSSSFIVRKANKLDDEAYDKLVNMGKYLGDYYDFEMADESSTSANKHHMYGLTKSEYVELYKSDAWDYVDKGDKLVFYTSMDNFDMYDYALDYVGVSECDVEIDYY